MKKVFASVLIALLLGLVMTTAVFALQDEPPAPTLSDAWAIFISLIGWPAFRVAAVNLLKLIRIVPDGAAGKVSYGLDVLFFGVVAWLVFSGKLDILTGIDAALGNIAVLIGNIIIILGGFTVSRGAGKMIYEKVRGEPLIGYSHSVKVSAK